MYGHKQRLTWRQLPLGTNNKTLDLEQNFFVLLTFVLPQLPVIRPCSPQYIALSEGPCCEDSLMVFFLLLPTRVLLSLPAYMESKVPTVSDHAFRFAYCPQNFSTSERTAMGQFGKVACPFILSDL